MNIQASKIELIHWLTELQDQKIIEQLQIFRAQQEKGLSDAHKALLNERLAIYKNDPTNVLDWKDIMEETESGL